MAKPLTPPYFSLISVGENLYAGLSRKEGYWEIALLDTQFTTVRTLSTSIRWDSNYGVLKTLSSGENIFAVLGQLGTLEVIHLDEKGQEIFRLSQNADGK